MTRINLIDPALLHTKHLVAEYRELPRIFRLVYEAEQRGLSPKTVRAPTKYVLGPGHVKFFYDKLGFLSNRFSLLVKECQRRGFKIQHTTHPTIQVARCWWGDWTPNQEEVSLNRARIADRMPK